MMIEEADEPHTIDDLRLLIREIKKFWLMGDKKVIAEAEKALWRVLRNSAKRLRK